MPPTDRSMLSPLEQRVGYYTDQIRGQLDDVYYNRAMERLKQLVESANAPETAAFQTNLSSTGPAPSTMLRRPEPFAQPGPLPSLNVPSLQTPPPAPTPAPPVRTTPAVPKDLKSFFPAQEWQALVKRNPQVKYIANQQDMMEALDNGRTIDAIQAGQRIGLDPDKMLAIIAEHGARKVVDDLGPKIEAAPDQETAQTIMRRGLGKLSLGQQRTAELALQPMVATKKTRDVVNTEKFGEHQAAFAEQMNGLTADQIRAAWPRYIKTVEPGVRPKFAIWAQALVNDAAANERADRLAKAQGASKEGQEERLYNSIKTSVHQSVAKETYLKFGGQGMSLSPDANGNLTFSIGANPEATKYYMARMKQLLDARLKTANLFKKYGDLPIVAEPIPVPPGSSSPGSFDPSQARPGWDAPGNAGGGGPSLSPDAQKAIIEATKTLNGKTYVKINGQWFEQ